MSEQENATEEVINEVEEKTEENIADEPKEEEPATEEEKKEEPEAVVNEETEQETEEKPHEDFEYVCPPEFDDRVEMRKMFVGGLDTSTTKEEFTEFFQDFGEITDVVVINSQQDSKRHFGFITFAKCDDLEECLLKRPHKFKERELDVKRAIPKGQASYGGEQKTKKLHVANIPKEMKEKELMDYLKSRHPKKYGSFEDVNILKDSDNNNRGYGFIVVSTEDFANRIAIGESQFTLGGRTMRISKAKPKGQGNYGGGYGRGGGGYAHGYTTGYDTGYGSGYGHGYGPGYGYGPARVGAYGGPNRYHPYQF